MPSPQAVLISDIHFTVNNLELASKALEMAIKKSEDLGVPLIIAGDLLDSKAVIRAECANRLLEIFHDRYHFNNDYLRPWILVGNHDLINEKGKEHSLNFLREYCNIVDEYTVSSSSPYNQLHLIPYKSNSEELQAILDMIPTGSTVICHQGLKGAHMGEYTQDRSSLPPEAFKRFRTISGHYHRSQDIKCGESGLFSYIGTPYTTSFGEAKDGPKGFRVLWDDGTLELVPTNLRAHRIAEARYTGDTSSIHQAYLDLKVNESDLLWFKIKGPYSALKDLKKSSISSIICRDNFKLDLICDDKVESSINNEKMTDTEILDKVIDNLSDTEGHKVELKNLWKELLQDDRIQDVLQDKKP